MRTVADARKRHHTLDALEALEAEHARRRRPRVLLSPAHEYRRLETLVLELLLRQRTGRVGQRVEDDVGGPRREKWREKDIHELIGHLARVVVRP